MTTNNDDTQRPTPWTRPGFIISAVVIAFIVIAGIVIAIATHHTTTPTPGVAGPTIATPAPTTTASNSGTDSVCGLSAAGPHTPLTAAPSGTTWQLVGKVAGPSAKNVGPGTVAAKIHSCFAHDANGALYAAANMLSDGLSGEIQPVDLARARLAQGRGYDATVEQAKASSGDNMPAGTGGTPTYQIAGFTYLNYSDQTATIVIVLRSTAGADAGQFSGAPLTLQWQSGDWKIVPNADGSNTPGYAISDSSAFIQWSGA